MQRQPLQRLISRVDVLLLAGACYLLFFHGLGSIGLLGPDEPRYAAVAREMYRSGDYITPRLLGAPWFEKPPLAYWGTAASYAIFGINEFAARLPSALVASVCVFFAYYAASRLWGRATALWAALIVASSTGFFVFARAISMDMPLTACLTFAMLSFLLAYRDTGRRRRNWFYAFYAFLGFGMLAKGPVALLLPALSLIGYLLLRGRLGEWKAWRPEGLILSFLIAAPWYIACAWANGYDFLQVFFINQNFERFTSTVHGHGRPLYFYLPALLMLTFPWTFLIIPALRRTLDRSDWILVWWAIVPIVFFSFSGSKLPGYILPSVPPIALLCSRVMGQHSTRAFRIAAFIESGTMLFIGIAFGFFGHMLGVDPHVNGRLIAVITFVLAAMLVVVALWLEPRFLAAVNLLGIFASVVVTTSFVLPRFEVTDTMRPWNSALEGVIPPAEMVFLYKPARWMEYGMQFYRDDHSRGIYSVDDLVKLTENAPRVFLITDDRSFAELSQIANVEMEIVRTIGKQTALWAWRPAETR